MGMKIIVGLGNPGNEYTRTPHNVGFRAVDTLCGMLGGSWKAENRFKALLASVSAEGEKLLLAKPQTFMNLSGESVAPLLNFYKIPPSALVVLLDEVHLEPGQIRIRTTGGIGGHNGLRSLVEKLGTPGFLRIRIGVGMGHHPVADLAARVLGQIDPEDEDAVNAGISRAAEAALCAVRKGADFAMNQYNARNP